VGPDFASLGTVVRDAVVPMLIAFMLAALGVRYLIRPYAAFAILDHPNERSLHARPTPRTGGLALLAGLGLGVASALALRRVADTRLLWFAFGTLLVGGVSFADDRYRLAPTPRFLLHAAAAGLVLLGGWTPGELGLPFGSWAWPKLVAWGFTFCFVIWMINLYNFMDGMDGFAGGMAVIGFGFLGMIGWRGGESLFALLNAMVVSAAAGFLLFNFPPARIFMGDTGSSTLGFLAAASILWADRAAILPLWLGILIFSPFVVDATVTLLRRVFRGERAWEAHRTHYYQRVVQLGWGHRQTVLVEYVLMVLAGLTALLVASTPQGTVASLVLAAWVLCYMVLVAGVNALERRKRQTEL
jgi:UDP-N-acetylmuramyl pentapeptide phosphotransferase/UDP-N-acetylglucosamine-1-phosphate transferase